MTGDDSLALDSITSDYRFMLEHDVSMLEIALAAVSFEDCSLDDAVPLDRASVAYDCWLMQSIPTLRKGPAQCLIIPLSTSCRFVFSEVFTDTGE